MLRAVLIVGTLQGCLERVTGEAVPLDQRFTAQAETPTTSDDTAAPAHSPMEHQTVEHVEVPPPQPFQDHEGARVEISGLITSSVEGAVDLDVATIDDSVEGGLVREGKIMLTGPGPFSISIPEGAGAIRLAGFQDLQSDGPTEDDPYAELDITVGSEPIGALELLLVKGARGSASGGPEHQNRAHVEMPPGHGSEPTTTSGGAPTSTDPFEGVEGPRVKVSGVLESSVEGTIDLDLFKEDDSAPGGRQLLGKLKRAPGEFEILVPTSIGVLELDAFVDLTGDGPSGDDPRGSAESLQVSSGPIDGVRITLVSMGELPPEPAAEKSGTDLEEEFAKTRAGGAAGTDSDLGM